MKLNITLKNSCFAMTVTAMGLLTGCTPDEVKSGNPLTQTDLDASFAVTPADAVGNRYTYKASEDADISFHTWRTTSLEDDDTGEAKGPATGDLFFPDAGTYTIQHRVVGRVGGTNTLTTKTVVVPTPDPIAGNLVQGGKFTQGQGPWQVLNISATGAAWTFADKKATITVSGSNQQAIYQAIEVEAGVPYKVDMKVSGAGSTDTWFEVYLSPTAPTQNNDYSADGVRLQLNTWAGCAKEAFDGLISKVGCGGSGNPITFATSGTVYLLIKSGGASSTISIDNVELRRAL